MRVLADGGFTSTDNVLLHISTKGWQSQTQQQQDPHG
jgi:hypothetical protein